MQHIHPKWWTWHKPKQKEDGVILQSTSGIMLAVIISSSWMTNRKLLKLISIPSFIFIMLTALGQVDMSIGSHWTIPTIQLSPLTISARRNVCPWLCVSACVSLDAGVQYSVFQTKCGEQLTVGKSILELRGDIHWIEKFLIFATKHTNFILT